VSRASDRKRARRKKRKAASSWIPTAVAEELEIAADLEEFDTRLAERGWEFADEDDAGVFWVWPPSAVDVGNDAERADATVILLTPEDDGEIAHVVFVGTAEDYQFGLDELFDHIEAIEAHRYGAPLPSFGS
jgi:hypothetical protein